MGRRQFTAEQIINMLREAEVLLNQGVTVGEVCRKLGISEQTYFRWRKDYGGMRVDQTYTTVKPTSLKKAAIEQGFTPRLSAGAMYHLPLRPDSSLHLRRIVCEYEQRLSGNVQKPQTGLNENAHYNASKFPITRGTGLHRI